MSHALRTLTTGVLIAQRSVSAQPLLRPVSAVNTRAQQRSRSDGVKGSESQAFDVSLLEFLVCPLSKKPLRYDCSPCIILLPYVKIVIIGVQWQCWCYTIGWKCSLRTFIMADIDIASDKYHLLQLICLLLFFNDMLLIIKYF